MKRLDIRKLKQSVRTQHNAEAMQALLERSVQFGHKRLALLRCMQLEQMGVQVHPGLLHYCRNVAESMPRDALEKIMRQAADTPACRFDDTNLQACVPSIFP